MKIRLLAAVIFLLSQSTTGMSREEAPDSDELLVESYTQFLRKDLQRLPLLFPNHKVTKKTIPGHEPESLIQTYLVENNGVSFRLFGNSKIERISFLDSQFKTNRGLKIGDTFCDAKIIYPNWKAKLNSDHGLYVTLENMLGDIVLTFPVPDESTGAMLLSEDKDNQVAFCGFRLKEIHLNNTFPANFYTSALLDDAGEVIKKTNEKLYNQRMPLKDVERVKKLLVARLDEISMESMGKAKEFNIENKEHFYIGKLLDIAEIYTEYDLKKARKILNYLSPKINAYPESGLHTKLLYYQFLNHFLNEGYDDAKVFMDKALEKAKNEVSGFRLTQLEDEKYRLASVLGNVKFTAEPKKRYYTSHVDSTERMRQFLYTKDIKSAFKIIDEYISLARRKKRLTTPKEEAYYLLSLWIHNIIEDNGISEKRKGFDEIILKYLSKDLIFSKQASRIIDACKKNVELCLETYKRTPMYYNDAHL